MAGVVRSGSVLMRSPQPVASERIALATAKRMSFVAAMCLRLRRARLAMGQRSKTPARNGW